MTRERSAPTNWTPAEDERLQSMARGGSTAKDIAAELRRSVAAVHSRALRAGLSLKQVRVKSKLSSF
jgi:DNA-directed RNA polymerase specialized sigma24 family protein